MLPTDGTLTNGLGTFSVMLDTSGNQTVTAADTVNGTISGVSGMIATAAAAATHFTVSAPVTSTAGMVFTITVTAQDAYGNTATSYNGTVQVTSSDGSAVLPADGTLTNGLGTFSVTLDTSGNQTVTAADTVNGTIAGVSGTIATAAAAATHFTVSAPVTSTAGTAFTITVTAQDAYGNTATSYSGTVQVTSSDGSAVLPAEGTLTNGLGTFSVTLDTSGNQTVTATDTVSGSITGVSGTIATAAAAATHFTVGAPATSTAGTAFTIMVTAQDAYGNTATSYSGTVHFTSSDGSAVLPADGTLTNGLGTFSVTLDTSGNQTVTATDTVSGTISGVSGTIATAAAAATHFTVGAPATSTAGTAFTITVTAQDAYGNTATSYSGTVHVTSSDGSAVLPADGTLTNGLGTFSVTLDTSGNQTVTATDTVSGSITGVSGTIATAAAAATHFTVGAPATSTAGTAFTIMVTAQDAYGNTATSYSGTVHVTSSDGSAVLPADGTLTNGLGTFSVLLDTSGNQTVRATDTVSGTISGVSGTIATAAAAVTHFTVSAPVTSTAGTAFTITVTAQDAYGNTAKSYSGTVQVTSSDGSAVLPADGTLTNGLGTFSVTLDTSGNQTVTATDTVSGSISGVSGTIATAAAAATHFTVSAPVTSTADTAFTIMVTAQDAYGNTATSYSGTVHVTSSDGSAVLPADGTLTNGLGTFSVTLDTSGNQTVTATDTVSGTISGVSGTIATAAAAVTHFTVSAPVTSTAGTAFTITVTAQDAYGNTAKSYSGTVQVTSSDGSAVLPADGTLTNGLGTFSVTLDTSGNQTVTATDTVSGTISGVSGTIATAAAAATHFTVSARRRPRRAWSSRSR